MSKELTQAVAGKRIAWLLAILAAMAMLATVAQTAKHAHAASAITTVGTATASIATNGASGSGVYTNVSNIVLTEGAATDISVGANTFTITAPTGWAWNTSAALPTITGGGADITAKTVTQTSASVITVGVTAGGTATVDVITISGLYARPINPATAIGSANGAAAVTAGAIAGFPIAAAVTFTATAAATPTATVAPPTATPTVSVTATPTVAPTSTPTPIVVPVAPGPPATGNGAFAGHGGTSPAALLMLGIAAISVTMGLVLAGRRVVRWRYIP